MVLLLSVIAWVNTVMFGCSDIEVFYGIVSTRNNPKFSDRYVKANSAEPDQTAPRGGSGSSLFAIPFAYF